MAKVRINDLLKYIAKGPVPLEYIPLIISDLVAFGYKENRISQYVNSLEGCRYYDVDKVIASIEPPEKPGKHVCTVAMELGWRENGRHQFRPKQGTKVQATLQFEEVTWNDQILDLLVSDVARCCIERDTRIKIFGAILSLEKGPDYINSFVWHNLDGIPRCPIADGAGRMRGKVQHPWGVLVKQLKLYSGRSWADFKSDNQAVFDRYYNDRDKKAAIIVCSICGVAKDPSKLQRGVCTDTKACEQGRSWEAVQRRIHESAH